MGKLSLHRTGALSHPPTPITHTHTHTVNSLPPPSVFPFLLGCYVISNGQTDSPLFLLSSSYAKLAASVVTFMVGFVMEKL